MLPVKLSGFSGGVIVGRNPCAIPQLVAPKAQKPLKLSVSAKYGGFSHSPCPPWFHDESWKIAYPARSAVVWLPSTFHASPILGSNAVLSSSIPTRPSL